MKVYVVFSIQDVYDSQDDFLGIELTLDKIFATEAGAQNYIGDREDYEIQEMEVEE